MVKKVLIIIFLVFVVGAGLYLTRYQKPLFGNLDDYFARRAPVLQNSRELPKQTAEEADVTIEATPVMFSSVGVDFTVRFTTHSVDLDFNLLEKAELQDNKGRSFRPVSWDGGRGGHHLFGTLKFPSFNEKISFMKLIIKDVPGVSERIFEWKI